MTPEQFWEVVHGSRRALMMFDDEDDYVDEPEERASGSEAEPDCG